MASFASITEYGVVGPTTPIIVYGIHQRVGGSGAGTTTVKLGNDSGPTLFYLRGNANTSQTHTFNQGFIVDGGIYADMAAEATLITLIYENL